MVAEKNNNSAVCIGLDGDTRAGSAASSADALRTLERMLVKARRGDHPAVFRAARYLDQTHPAGDPAGAGDAP